MLKKKEKKKVCKLGIEPGLSAWKATVLTITPPRLILTLEHLKI